MGRQLGRGTPAGARRLPSLIVAAFAVALAGLAGPTGWVADATSQGTAWIELSRGVLAAFWLWTAARAGRAWAARCDPGRTASGHALRTFLGALLYALVSGALAAALRRFDVLSLTLVHALAFVGLAVHPTPDGARGRCSLARLARGAVEHPLQALVLLLLVGLGVANAAWAILSPVYHIDDLVYHLSFPVEWAQRGALDMRLIPFGNHSPSYHPKNVELLYAWLFLPLGRIEVASLVQVAFAAASVCAAYDVLRSLGTGAPAALVASCLLLASATVTRFFDSAYVDFAFMFALLASLMALLRLRAGPAGGHRLAGWVELWAALGLLAGIKSFGVLFTALVVLPAGLVLLRDHLRAAARPTARTALAGLLVAAGAWTAAGGWWTLRNLLVTGNPIFPMKVELAGVELFDGAYTRAAFESARLRRLLPLIPWPLWIAVAAGAVATIARALRPGAGGDERTRALVTVLIPLALAAVFALLLPTGNPRFVLAIVPLAAGALATPLEARRPVATVFAALLLGALLWTLVAKTPNVLMPVRGGSLLHTPLVDAAFAALCTALALTILTLSVRVPRPGAWWLLIGTLGLPSLVAAAHTSDPAGAHVPERVSRAWRPYLDLEREHGPARLALTGTNQTLRAYGRRYANHVGYANVNDSGAALFHEHFRRMRDSVTPTSDDESGLVYYRAQPDYEAWLRNLEAMDAELLLVAPLPPWARQQDYARDSAGFPLEHTWAVGHPERFERLASAPGLRVFRILPGP